MKNCEKINSENCSVFALFGNIGRGFPIKIFENCSYSDCFRIHYLVILYIFSIDNITNNVIYFSRLFFRITHLELENTTESEVAFKIKTNAPTRYEK